MKKIIALTLTILFLISCKKESAKDLLPNNQVIEYPIVFHIVHEGASVGTGDNLNASIVKYLISSLNNNYTLSNTGIKFRLATKKPDNTIMAEPGIDRINLGRTSIPFSEIYTNNWGKSYLWNPDEYINVFIADVTNPQADGWATLPFNKHGIKESQKIEGLPSTNESDISSFPNNQSIFLVKYYIEYQASINLQPQHTFSHEMGHFLGLLHTYSSQCGTESDYCEDTKHWSIANSSVTSSNRISCDNISFIDNNMMGIGPLNIPRYFTANQISRMRKVSSYCLFRENVWKSIK